MEVTLPLCDFPRHSLALAWMDRVMRSWALTGRPLNQLPETMALCTLLVAVKVVQTKPGATNTARCVFMRSVTTFIVALEFHRNTSHHRALKEQVQFHSTQRLTTSRESMAALSFQAVDATTEA
jgi:hypothetical protein